MDRIPYSKSKKSDLFKISLTGTETKNISCNKHCSLFSEICSTTCIEGVTWQKLCLMMGFGLVCGLRFLMFCMENQEKHGLALFSGKLVVPSEKNLHKFLSCKNSYNFVNLFYFSELSHCLNFLRKKYQKKLGQMQQNSTYTVTV